MGSRKLSTVAAGAVPGSKHEVFHIDVVVEIQF